MQGTNGAVLPAAAGFPDFPSVCFAGSALGGGCLLSSQVPEVIKHVHLKSTFALASGSKA